MADSFTQPYQNPRTGHMTTGAAAQSGRIKTLGGMDNIVKDIIKETTEMVTSSLIHKADNPPKVG